MTDVMAGTLVGGGISAALLLIGAVSKALFSAGEHKKAIDSHEVRLDDHDDKFEKLPDHYVTRTEIAGQLDAIRDSNKRTERWVEFLVKKEAVPPETR